MYTEVCVRDAVRGLMRIAPHIRIHLVTDATADIGPDGRSYRDKWKSAGVDLISVADLERLLSESVLFSGHPI